MTTSRADFLRRGHRSVRSLIDLDVYRLFSDHWPVVVRTSLKGKKYRLREPYVSTIMSGNIEGDSAFIHYLKLYASKLLWWNNRGFQCGKYNLLASDERDPMNVLLRRFSAEVKWSNSLYELNLLHKLLVFQDYVWPIPIRSSSGEDRKAVVSKYPSTPVD